MAHNNQLVFHLMMTTMDDDDNIRWRGRQFIQQRGWRAMLAFYLMAMGRNAMAAEVVRWNLTINFFSSDETTWTMMTTNEDVGDNFPTTTTTTTRRVVFLAAESFPTTS